MIINGFRLTGESFSTNSGRLFGCWPLALSFWLNPISLSYSIIIISRGVLNPEGFNTTKRSLLLTEIYVQAFAPCSLPLAPRLFRSPFSVLRSPFYLFFFITDATAADKRSITSSRLPVASISSILPCFLYTSREGFVLVSYSSSRRIIISVDWS